MVARFIAGGFPVEIFGQPRAVRRQRGFRHLVAEARLLGLGGDAARRAIRRLKEQGLKTELAFAKYFALSGDPYAVLLRLADAPEEELATIAARRPGDYWNGQPS